jgi:hypothetical protein
LDRKEGARRRRGELLGPGACAILGAVGVDVTATPYWRAGVVPGVDLEIIGCARQYCLRSFCGGGDWR